MKTKQFHRWYDVGRLYRKDFLLILERMKLYGIELSYIEDKGLINSIFYVKASKAAHELIRKTFSC